MGSFCGIDIGGTFTGTHANPHLREPVVHVGVPGRLRKVTCPRSGRLLQTEIVVDDAPPEWDLRPGQ